MAILTPPRLVWVGAGAVVRAQGVAKRSVRVKSHGGGVISVPRVRHGRSSALAAANNAVVAVVVDKVVDVRKS